MRNQWTAGALCLLLCLCGCGAQEGPQRDMQSVPALVGESGSEAPSEPESVLEEAEPSSAVPSSSSEPTAQQAGPAGTYEPAEWSDWLEDPTLIDDMNWSWDHLEYRVFGSPEVYSEHSKTVVEYDEGWNVIREEQMTYCLPAIAHDDSVLWVDLGFAHGPIKFGGLGNSFDVLREGEDLSKICEGIYSRERLVAGWGDPSEDFVETRDNVVGGICEGENYLRGIGPLNKLNNQVTYAVELREGCWTSLYFYVSVQATAEDLALYDAIAESVRIVDA